MKKIISIFSCFVALLFIFPITTFALAPAAPTVTLPTTPTLINTPYWVNFSSTDPEGNPVYYQFDWDRNGSYEESYPTSGTVSSGGAPRSIQHTWTSYGNNSFYVRAIDSTGAISNITSYSLNIIDPSPTAPTITGPAGPLQINTSYDFTFVSTDPNNRQISYEAEFDNSTFTIFLPPFFGYVNSGISQTASKSYTTSGAHYLRVRSKNNNGNYSPWSTYNFTVLAPNVAPSNPIVSNSSGTVNFPVQFIFSSSDPNGDNVRYEIDWDGNGTIDENVPINGYLAQNSTQSVFYTWYTPGTVNPRFRAVDQNNASSGWTTRTVQIFAVNVAPGVPTITLVPGQSPLYPNTSYQFSVQADDPDSGQVAYWIDWDNDGSYEAGTILSPDNTPTTISNPAGTWMTPGSYNFRVRSTDANGESSSGVSFTVTITSPPAPTVSLSLTPPFLTQGVPTPLTINWSSTNASSCNAVGLTWPGHNTLSGTYSYVPPINIPGPRQYTWVCTGNGMTATTTVYLGYPVDLWGWGWSSNVGWISFSSANLGVGAGSPYSVKMGTTTTTGYLGGWAWSPNIGWISFSHGDGSHPNATVDFSTGAVSGWARACAATVNRSCTGATRPDWDGWISLSGTNHDSPGPGVSYDASTGKFRGFSWGSDVIGWLTVDSLISPPLQGPLVISTSTGSCNLNVNPSTLPASGGTVNLSWTSSGVVGNSCNLTGPNGYSSTNLSGTGNRNITINSGDSGGRYDLRCNTDRIICSANLTKGGGGGPPIINPFPKMWLDNDPGEAKVITTIRQGQIAKVNWKFGARYPDCVGVNVSQTNASLPSASTWFGAGSEIASNVYLSTINNLTEGVYELKLLCGPGSYSTNAVKIIVKGANSTVIEEI